jgi:hypothetical protein
MDGKTLTGSARIGVSNCVCVRACVCVCGCAYARSRAKHTPLQGSKGPRCNVFRERTEEWGKGEEERWPSLSSHVKDMEGVGSGKWWKSVGLPTLGRCVSPDGVSCGIAII